MDFKPNAICIFGISCMCMCCACIKTSCKVVKPADIDELIDKAQISKTNFDGLRICTVLYKKNIKCIRNKEKGKAKHTVRKE